MKRKKNRKLSLGKVTLGTLASVSGAGRHYSDVMGCSNSCSQPDKPCTLPTIGRELCGDTDGNAW